MLRRSRRGGRQRLPIELRAARRSRRIAHAGDRGPTGMTGLDFLLSPSGRLRPQAFLYGALAVYLLGAASHLLTVPDVIRRAGLWPFVAAQALLIWIWFV